MILPGVPDFLRALTCTTTAKVWPAACSASVAEDTGAAGGADGDSRDAGVPAQRVPAGSDVPRETCNTLQLL